MTMLVIDKPTGLCGCPETFIGIVEILPGRI
jgi:hypothetical protein